MSKMAHVLRVPQRLRIYVSFTSHGCTKQIVPPESTCTTTRSQATHEVRSVFKVGACKCVFGATHDKSGSAEKSRENTLRGKQRTDGHLFFMQRHILAETLARPGKKRAFQTTVLQHPSWVAGRGATPLF